MAFFPNKGKFLRVIHLYNGYKAINNNNNNNNNNNTIPVVIGALGTIKKDMDKCSNKIPGSISIHELQKVTLLSTPHLLRRILPIK